MQLRILPVFLLAAVTDAFTYSTVMVNVPGGSISIGEGTGLPWSPQRTVSVAAFQMAATEVSNSEFVTFLNEFPATSLVSDPSNPQIIRLFDTTRADHLKPLVTVSSPTVVPLPASSQIYDNGVAAVPRFSVVTGKGDYPVTWVSFYGASLFAEKCGKWLPTGPEWEAAAGQTSAYAGGNTLVCMTNAVCGTSAPEPTTSLKNSVTTPPSASVSIKGLVGNVAEWTTDNEGNSYINDSISSGGNPVNTFGYDAGKALDTQLKFYNRKVVKGGSFKDSQTTMPTTKQHRSVAYTYMGADVGLRVVTLTTPTARKVFTNGLLEECLPHEYQAVTQVDTTLLKISITCSSCHDSCESCSGPLSTNCLTCPGNIAISTTGTCSCPSGFTMNSTGKCVDSNLCGLHQFWSQGTCNECDQLCKTCALTFSQCSSCPANTVPSSTNGCQCAPGFSLSALGCVSDGSLFKCPHGYYPSASTGACIACSPTCRNCQTSATTCLTCWPNATLSAAACTCTSPYVAGTDGKCMCPTGKFVDTTGACILCDTSCVTCVNSATNCLTCGANKVLVNGTCVCAAGMILNTSTNVCSVPTTGCADSCQTCYGVLPTQCITCSKVGQTLQTDGSCDCLPRQYYVSTVTPAVCKACSVSCLRCYGPSANQCIKCTSHAKLQTDNTCVCDLFYYMDVAGNCVPKPNSTVCPNLNMYLKDNGTCASCDLTCQTCLGPLPSHCMTCRDPAVLVSVEPGRFNFGFCQCLDKQYVSEDGYCLPCHGSCRKCTGAQATQCIGCELGFTYDLTSNQCVCPATFTYKDGACVKMPATTSTCLYFQYGTTTCTNCKQPCTSCTSDTACTACMPPRVLTGTQCMCGAGFFADVWGQCQACHSSCATCSGSSDSQCLTCPTSRLFSSNKCICDPNLSLLSVESKTCFVTGKVCSSGMYKNEKGECVHCHPACKECIGPSSRECVSCSLPARLYTTISPLFGMCSCDVGQYFDYLAGICGGCHASCADCVGPRSFECIVCGANAVLAKTEMGQECQCISGFVRDTLGQCGPTTSNCASRMFMNPTNNQCQACDSTCLSCQTAATLCTACISPFVLLNGVCKCPAGMARLATAVGCYTPADINCVNYDGGKCLTCSSSSFLDSTGLCQCNASAKKDVSGECYNPGSSPLCFEQSFFEPVSQTCMPCHPTCNTCSAGSMSNCLTCGHGRTKDANGLCSCAEGSFMGSDGGCYSCMSGCSRCTSPSMSDCQVCFTGLIMMATGGCFCSDTSMEWSDRDKQCTPLRHSQLCDVNQYLSTTGVCSLCAPTCASCTGPETDKCIQCASPYIKLQPSSTTATLTFKGVTLGVCGCNIGSFIAAPSCASCASNCAACQGSAVTQCFRCVQDASFDSAGACQCSPGYSYSATVFKCIPTGANASCNYAPRVYLPSGAVTCSACHSKCLTCSGPLATNCNVCDPAQGFLITDQTCSSCAVGFYLVAGACQPCDVTCADCSASTCITCLSTDMTVVSGTRTCSCNTGLTWNATYKKCLPSGVCPVGTYGNGTTCSPCISLCAACIGPAMSDCQTCVSPFVLQNGACQCADGFFLDPVSNICQACGATCQRCSGFADNCTECKQGFIMDIPTSTTTAATTTATTTATPQSFKCRCPINMRLSGAVCEPLLIDTRCTLSQFYANGACTACSSTGLCLTCTVNSVTCLTCKSGFLAKEKYDGTVDCVCPSGKFLSAGACNSCYGACAECSGPSGSQCTRCKAGMVFASNTCNCPSGSTLNASTYTCTPDGLGTCGMGRYSLTTTACQNCHPSCASCSGALATQCTGCDPYRFLVKDTTNSCVCQPGYFLQTGTTLTTCQACDVTCLTCSGTANNQCLTCRTSRILTTDKKCACAAAFFDDGSGKCLSLTAATTCTGASFQDEDGICKPCHTACLTCLGPAQWQCLTCAASYVGSSSFLASLKQCNCATGTYYTAGACVACSVVCKECYGGGDFQCNMCKAHAHFTQNSKGLSCECDSGFVRNTTGDCVPMATATGCLTSTGTIEPSPLRKYMKADGKCGDCNAYCWTCLGPNDYDCATCWEGAYLKYYFDTVTNNLDTSRGSCLCSDWGQYRNAAGGCSNCIINCSKCHGPLATDCDLCGSYSVMTTTGCQCQTGAAINASGYCMPTGTSNKCYFTMYFDTVTNACQSCSMNCLTCTGPRETDCASCYSSHSLITATDGSKSCKCSDGYYQIPMTTGSGGFINCGQCFSTCLTCSGPGNDQCLSCPGASGVFTLTNGQCLCASGTYYSPITKSCLTVDPTQMGQYVDALSPALTLKPCHASCVTCLGGTVNDCTSCGLGGLLQLVSGVDTSLATGTTTTAATSTVQWTNSTTTNSTKPMIFNFGRGFCLCSQDFFPDFSGRCFKCDSACMGCKGPSAYDCATCKVGFEWVSTSTGLMCGCPANRKLNSITGVCDPVSIFSGCDVKQYADSTGSCKPCSPLCTSCVGPSDSQCATCAPGAVLNVTSVGTVQYGKCVCDTYSFLNLTVTPPVCSKCNMLCLTCFGPSELECSSCEAMRELTTTTTGQKRCNCKTGYKEDIVTATCLPISGSTQCPSDKFLSTTGACMPCDPKCTSCSGAGPEQCLSCNLNLGYMLNKLTGANYGYCRCPSDKFMAADGGCQKCNPTCKTCTGATEALCSSCFPGSTLTPDYTTNTATCKCNSGTVYDATLYRCLSVSACAAGMFMDDNGNCGQMCSPLCTTCAGPGNQRCGACASGFTAKTPSDIPGLTTCLCPRHSFLNTTTGKCDNCDSTCGDCFGPAAFQCITCPDSRVLKTTIYGQECPCATGYILTSAGCVAVGSSALCAVNQYQDSTGACKPCDVTCISCSGPAASQCLICGPNSQHPSTTATVGPCVCLSTFFRHTDNTCVACMASCATCSSATTCASCLPDRVLQASPAVCVCQPGWVEDASGKCQPRATDTTCRSSEYKSGTNCLPCLSECTTCFGPSASDCASCDYLGNKKLNILNAANNSGMCVCKDGFFVNTTTRLCEKCHTSCLQCWGANDYQCTSCPTNSNLATMPTGKMCVCNSGYMWVETMQSCQSATSCAAGTFLAGLVSATTSCLPCHSTCATCTGPNASDCVTCKDSTMTKSSLGCTCLSGKFSNSGVCTVCDATCLTCHGPSQLDCDQCKANSVFQVATLATAAYKTCVCDTNFQPDTTGNCVAKKLTTCATSTQYVKADGTCAACHALCGGCYGPGQDQCFYCTGTGSTFFPREDINGNVVGKCDCGAGTYLSGTSCSACATNCKECTGGADTQCTVCAQYYAKDTTGKCVCSYGNTPCAPVTTGLCTFGFFNAGTGCQPCISDCESCIGPSASECLSCKSEARKVLVKNVSGLSGFCQCLPGYYMESGVCKACDASCATCSAAGTNSCLTCKAGAIPMTPGTASPCICKDSTYVLSPVTNTCVLKCTDVTKQPPACTATCTSPCSSCIGPSSSECLTCVSPWVALMQPGTSAVKCVCPDGTWFDPTATVANSCVACAKSCLTCLGPGDSQCTECKPSSTLSLAGAAASCPCNSGYVRNAVGDCSPIGTSSVCPPNNYLESTTGTCKLCHSSCQTCYGPSDTSCQLCPLNGMLTPIGSCTCKPGYWQTATYTCELCNKACLECKGSATSCTKCDSYSYLSSTTCNCITPYIRAADGLCKPPANGCSFANQFKNSANFCVMCDSTCETCDASGPQSCKSCVLSLNLKLALVDTLGHGTCVCADGYYMDTAAFYCNACDLHCRTCFGPSYQNCLTCSDVANLNLETKGCDCKPGFAWNKYVMKCISVTSCPAGQWFGTAGCLPCAPSCLECSGPSMSDCTKCSTTMLPITSYKDDTTQYYFCKCLDNQFTDSTGKCGTCHTKCTTCYGATEFQCLSCPPNSAIDNSISGQTPCKCIANFQRDASTGACSPVAIYSDCALSEFRSLAGVCTPCHTSCASCFDANAQSCATCPPGADFIVLSSTTSTVTFGKCACKSGSVFVSGKCVTCGGNCATCFGAGASECVTCKPNFMFVAGVCNCVAPLVLSGGNCTPVATNAACSVNQFMSTTGQCMSCHTNCLTCLGPSEYDCVSCYADQLKTLKPTTATATTGVCACKPGTYISSGKCVLCDSTCSSCAGPLSTDCWSCALTAMTYTGTTATPGACNCAAGTTWAPAKAACATSCTASQFLDGGGVCQACDPACTGCKGPGPDQCLACASTFTGPSGVVPVFCKCAPGKYFTGTSCANCDTTKCSECVSAADNCVRCADINMSLVNVSGKNVCQCKDGYTLSGTACNPVNQFGCSSANMYKDALGACQSCDTSCATCNGPSKYECVFCKANAVRTASPVGSCVCPAGFASNADFSCTQCASPCIACSTTACLTCPVGMYPSTLTCAACHSSCQACTGSLDTNCISCYANSNIVSGKCVCADGYVLSTVATAPGCVLAPTSTACLTNQFLDPTGKCSTCSSSCYTCTGPFDSNCVACTPGTNMVLQKLTTTSSLSVGKCVCASNSFQDPITYQCLPCDTTCLTCNGTGPEHCITCPATVAVAVTTGSGFRCDCATNYIFSPYTMKCEALSSFATGMWLDKSGITQKCHYSCTKCIGPNADECLDCGTTGVRVKDPAALATSLKWKCVCASGFETMGGDCGVCAGLCKTCTGADPAKCLSCKVNSQMPVLTGPAQCQCAVNYKLDSTGSVCQPVVFDTSCSTTQYKNAAGTCTSCHASCGTCIGGTDSDCLTCSVTNTYFLPATTQTPVTGKCLCISGFFWATTSCTACSNGCLECTSAAVCTRCKATFNLVSNACACPTGYTLSGTTCGPSTVATCSGTVGMYPIASGSTSCLPCHPSCLNCVGPTYSDCTSCKELTLRLTVITASNNSGTCGCPPGTFLSAGACQQCGPKCDTCSTAATTCLACRTGFTLAGTDCACSSGVYDAVRNVCINSSLCTSGFYPDPPTSTLTSDCKACPTPCVTCLFGSNKGCLTCPTGMNSVSTGQGTVSCECAFGTYFNPSTNACVNCSPTCSGCSGSPTNCLACPSGSNRELVTSGLTGTCNCKLGYTDVSGVCTAQVSGTCALGTWNNSGTCQPCSATCQSCVGAADTNCLLCKSSDMKAVDTDSNLANGVQCQCPAGTYWTGTSCASCPISCKTCTSATVCTTCKDGNDLTTTGVCQCKFGFTSVATLGTCSPPASSSACLFNQYMDSSVSPSVCKSCDSSCLTCSGPSPSQCVQCGQNASFDANKLCVCNAGYFFSLTLFTCVACDASCAKCKAAGTTSCTACVTTKHVDATGACVCDTGYTVSGTGCVLTVQGSCQANQYLVGTTCTNCDVACANCSGAGAAACLVCTTGYVKDASSTCVCKGFLSGTTCTACHPTCLTCNGAASTNCLSCASTATLASNTCTCKSGYFWDPNTNQCVQIPSCPSKTYFDTTLRSCQACYFMCATCSGAGYDKCVSCISGSTGTAVSGSGTNCQCNSGMYYAQLKSMCVTIPTCTTGTFLDTGLYECKACDVSCKECKGPSPQNCSACNTGLTLWTTNECKCADGFFFSRTDGKCIACNISCTLCFGPGNNSCSQCATGFIMNTANTCQCNVQNSYYLTTTGECKACNSACLTCVDSSNDKCLSCKQRSSLVIANLGVDKFGVCVCDTDSYFNTTAGACIAKPGCFGSTFVSQSASGGIQCLPCDKSCLQCADSKATDCLQCPAERKFVKNSVPTTYTGPITGKCDCKFTNALDPTKCDPIECPSGFFYDTRSTLLAGVCTACHADCKTCVGPSNFDCRSCPDNRAPTDPVGFFKTNCKCKPEYLYPDGLCGATMYVNQTASGGCPLNRALCSASTCQFTIGGVLVKPTPDTCLKAIYDYCCFSEGRTQCSGLGQTFDQCDKISPPFVTPNTPVPQAYFSDDGMRVQIKFSAPVKFLKQSCSSIFSNPSVLTTSSCQIPDGQSVLIISLAPDHLLTPDTGTTTTTTTTSTTTTSTTAGTTSTAAVSTRTSTLKINAGVFMSVNNFASATNSEITVTLKAPATTADINLQLTYPSVISKCQPYIHIDASASTGGGARPLTFKWSIPAGFGTIVVDPVRTDQADIKNFSTLTVDSLTVTVTASNFLGKTVTRDLTIKLLGGLAPQVSLPFSTFTLGPDKEFSVYMQATAPGCSTVSGGTAASSTFTYQWSLDSSTVTTSTPSTTAGTSLNSSTESAKLKIAANTLAPGATYVFKAGATMDGSTWGYALLKIAVTSPGLNVFVTGGNRDMSIKETLTLTTERSGDPLNPTPSSKGDWTYKWTCEDWTSFGSTNPIYADGVADTTMDPNVFTTYKSYKYTDCTDASNSLLMNSLKGTLDSLTVPAGAIPSNRTYYFKATATKGTRSGFGYSFIRTKAYTRTSKTTIQYYGKNLNSTGINTLTCNADCPAGCSMWWNVLTPNANVKWLSTDLTKPVVAFSGDGLVSDTVYKFECATSFNGEAMSAIAELSLNSAPSGGSFEMTPFEGNVTTVFTATFSNWVDKEGDYPLKYRLWLREDPVQTLLRVSDNSRIDGLTLPARVNRSMFLISSEICDSFGNCRLSDNRYIRIQPLSDKNASSAVGTMLNDFGKGRDNQNKQERTGTLSIVVQTMSGSVGSVDPTVVSNVLTSVNTECSGTTASETDTLSQCLDMYKGLATSSSTPSQVEAPFLNLLDVMTRSTTPPSTATLTSALETIGNLREVNAKNDTTPPIDLQEMMNKLAAAVLTNTPTSAPVTLVTGTTAATFENKDPSDMLASGTAFNAPAAVTTDSTTKEGRRLQTTGKYRVAIPPCFVPKLATNATYRVGYLTSSKSDFTFATDRNRSSYDADLSLTDSQGNALLVKNDSCPDPITICSQFIAPAGFYPPQNGVYNPATKSLGYYTNSTETVGNFSGSQNLTDWSFPCQYWDTVKKAWSEDGIIQNQTVIFWSNKTICCKTTHLTSFSAATIFHAPVPFSPAPERPQPVYNEHSDSFDGWDNFTGFYVGVILVGVELLLVALGFFLDLFGKHDTPSHIIATSQSHMLQNQSHELEKNVVTFTDVQAFEATEHKAFEGDLKKIQDQTVPGIETPSSHSDIPAVISEPSFCRFFFYNFFLTGFLIKYKSTYSRSARAAQMCSILLIELFITGLLTPVSGMRHFVCPALIAVALALPASPLLTLAFYLPSGMSKFVRSLKVVFGILLALSVIFGSLGACAYSADNLSYDDVQYWLKAFGVAVGLELIASQALKTLLKKALCSVAKCSEGCHKIMTEV